MAWIISRVFESRIRCMRSTHYSQGHWHEPLVHEEPRRVKLNQACVYSLLNLEECGLGLWGLTLVVSLDALQVSTGWLR